MKDYYKILGVDEEATEEEIRACWLELTKYYHPDVEKGIGSEEKIKEINEAYEVLKDESTRFDYDLQRALKKSILKKRQSGKEKSFFSKRVLLFAALAVFFLMGGLIFFISHWVPVQPKSELRYEISKILEKKPVPPVKLSEIKEEVKPVEKEVRPKEEVIPPRGVKSEIPKKLEKEVPVEKETKPKEEVVPEGVVKSEMPRKVEKGVPVEKEVKPKEEVVPPRVMKSEMPRKVEKEVPVEKETKPKEEVVPEGVVKSEIPWKVEKEVLKEATPVPLQPGETLPLKTKEEKEVQKEMGKVLSQERAKMEQPRPVVTEPQPVKKSEIPVKTEKIVPILPSAVAREEEVKQFLSNYVSQYIRKDIHGFLSLFSSTAIQNQKDDLEKIRSIYTNFFDQSEELRYGLEGVKIEIYQNMVEVKARYRVDQKLKKRGETKIWIGDIRWVLVKEEGVLRISLLYYQDEKSP